MAHIITGLFTDSKQAGEAIAELKNKGFTKEISLVTKDYTRTDGGTTHTIKEDVGDGALAGGAMGAALGALTALLVGASSFVIPGAGLLVTGPLAIALSGATAGAVTGGIVGALVDQGIPDDKAKMYQGRLEHGDVLVAVKADKDKTGDVTAVLNQHEAAEITTGNTDVS